MATVGRLLNFQMMMLNFQTVMVAGLLDWGWKQLVEAQFLLCSVVCALVEVIFGDLLLQFFGGTQCNRFSQLLMVL